ncbi:hypothetical protein SAMN05421819_2050 [Bryocella elongata]|uniref:Response regulatory domain-containing protein n=1 Tax=Bryocella elongata TaxID=863522 RepID=A0A1H5XZS1_9BACT|nr:response regulator [Bryocella elongata]SEG17173.1 hypothetical protein SAMN05421819_2050 [Bryocella elongata]
MSEQNLMDAPSHDAAGDFDSADFGTESYGDREFEAGSAGPNGQPAPGMGQSKSSRRRRRKRKNKQSPGETGAGSVAASVSEAPIVMEGESLALAASAAPVAAQAQPQSQRRQQGSSQRNGDQRNSDPRGGADQRSGDQQGPGKRWKKKFRDRERRPRNENPGNEVRSEASSSSSGREHRPDNFGNLSSGFKRKGKSGGGQSRERTGFVGPMDHSYREASADFPQAPASTIQLNGRRGGHRHHGDNQPIDHSMPRAVPIPEGAQTHIYFFIEELFFVAKIQEAARKLGVKVAFMKGDNKEALAELTSGEEVNKPALIVFDLNNANAKPMTLIPKLKAKLKRSVSVIGFLSHLQGDLKAKAVEAGCDVVMPRSAFSQNLPNLLRRYGVHEEEEINYNY